MSDSSLPASCPVLVVGAGPVGLTLAAHLHRHGLACRIIDRSPAPSDKSKALVVWGRTLEMLEDLGIVGDFTNAGRFLHAARFHGNGRLLVRLPFAVADTEYPRPLLLPQSETERLLTEHLARSGLTVERSVELIDFTDHGDGIVARLRHADGRDEPIRCAWLLGCDGAHSTTRKQLRLEFTGEARPNDFFLADCRVDGPFPADELSMFWHPKGVLGFFPIAGDLFRIIADRGLAKGTDHPPDPSLADVQAIIAERGLPGVRLSEPHWLSAFRIHERKVADYRRGRVFLAGDAAHIHSPAGGQGMNTGMQDAWNLVWKLALVHAGRAKPSLLDSYTPERGQEGERVLRNAGRVTMLATLRNPIGQFIRNHLVGLLGQFAVLRKAFVRNLSELTVHYPHSPLNGESSGTRWASGSIRPGDRVPDAPLRQPATGRSERLLVLLRGPQHNLLLLPSSADVSGFSDIRQRIESAYPEVIRVHLIVPGESAPVEASGFASVWLDPDDCVRRSLGARETALALVRPDGYLGYRGQPASWEGLRGYLDRYLIARNG